MKLYIKHMANIRCQIVVEAELTKLGLHCLQVSLGQVEIKERLSEPQREQVARALKKVELELIVDKKSILIEKIKTAIVEFVHSSEELPHENLSAYLSEKLHHDYTYLANIFSEVEGISIKKFLINQRIEKVKDLLVNEELSLTDIAYKLDYCNVAHLSNQFKKITGLPPSHFKNLSNN